MKVPPLNLNPDMNRVGMALPFSPDLLWRYPLSLQQTVLAPPSSPLLDVKNQMPAQLAADPRLWSREDVSTFLRWFEREFELPKIDSTKFCMNGKALCMLTKNDLADRAPGAGDVLHNTLQFLLRDAPQVPPSPLTPHHPLLSPSPLTTPSQPWSLVGSDFHTIGHLLQQGGSVTLSPAPSEQSGGSPRHPDPSSSGTYHHSSSSTGSTHSGSHSDSEESTRDSSPQRSPIPSQSTQSFSAQALASLKHLTDYQRAAAAAAAAAAVAAHNYENIPQQQQQFSHNQSRQSPQQHPYQSQQSSQQQSQQQHPSPPFNNDEPVETVTNGRLLWDFLQQLLNDPQQRYQQYIAWKNRDTGVFKIVDPPGLARLWGIQKNHLSMNYDKMSRALRYYYRVNILRKVQGERHCYQFLRNPSELKSIKNISLLRGAPVPLPKKWELLPLPSTPMEEESLTGLSSISLPRKWEAPAPHSATPMDDEGPTDLSMPNSQQQSRSEMVSPDTYRSQQPFERQADVTITTAHQQQFKRPDMETQPENLTIEKQDIKTECFSAESFE